MRSKNRYPRKSSRCRSRRRKLSRRRCISKRKLSRGRCISKRKQFRSPENAAENKSVLGKRTISSLLDAANVVNEQNLYNKIEERSKTLKIPPKYLNSEVFALKLIVDKQLLMTYIATMYSILEKQQIETQKQIAFIYDARKPNVFENYKIIINIIKRILDNFTDKISIITFHIIMTADKLPSYDLNEFQKKFLSILEEKKYALLLKTIDNSSFEIMKTKPLTLENDTQINTFYVKDKNWYIYISDELRTMLENRQWEKQFNKVMLYLNQNNYLVRLPEE